MKLSIVDLSQVIPGETRHEALMHSIDLAQRAEAWGYNRIWYAEHHSTPGLAGRAPEVVMAAVAAHTSRLRVGSGSVLLNHYSPYKVAEVFGTLNELYPGRVDLGAGRATTGPVSDLALQQDRSKRFNADSDAQIVELLAWLENDFPAGHPFGESPVYTDAPPELYLLGSSPWSASAASQLGLRYVFAGFINQAGTPHITRSYRENFTPGEGRVRSARPWLMLSAHVVVADTEEEARRQLAPVHMLYRFLAQGRVREASLTPGQAVDRLGGLPELERYEKGSGMPPRFIGGTIDQVEEQLRALAADVQADEIMIQDLVTEHDARLRSYELLSTLIDTDDEDARTDVHASASGA